VLVTIKISYVVKLVEINNQLMVNLTKKVIILTIWKSENKMVLDSEPSTGVPLSEKRRDLDLWTFDLEI